MGTCSSRAPWGSAVHSIIFICLSVCSCIGSITCFTDVHLHIWRSEGTLSFHSAGDTTLLTVSKETRLPGQWIPEIWFFSPPQSRTCRCGLPLVTFLGFWALNSHPHIGMTICDWLRHLLNPKYDLIYANDNVWTILRNFFFWYQFSAFVSSSWDAS